MARAPFAPTRDQLVAELDSRQWPGGVSYKRLVDEEVERVGATILATQSAIRAAARQPVQRTEEQQRRLFDQAGLYGHPSTVYWHDHPGTPSFALQTPFAALPELQEDFEYNFWAESHINAVRVRGEVRWPIGSLHLAIEQALIAVPKKDVRGNIGSREGAATRLPLAVSPQTLKGPMSHVWLGATFEHPARSQKISKIRNIDVIEARGQAANLEGIGDVLSMLLAADEVAKGALLQIVTRRETSRPQLPEIVIAG